MRCELGAEAGVGQGVDGVGDEVYGYVGEADGEDAALDEGVVAVGDGGERQAAEAGPAEDRLGDDGAGQQRAELEADDRQDGVQRVAECVAVDHRIFRQALGAGGADVVLAELLEHGRADHAGEDGGQAEAEGDGGQDEVAEEVGSADACSRDRKPAEGYGED